jgi:hypothetical protein
MISRCRRVQERNVLEILVMRHKDVLAYVMKVQGFPILRAQTFLSFRSNYILQCSTVVGIDSTLNYVLVAVDLMQM